MEGVSGRAVTGATSPASRRGTWLPFGLIFLVTWIVGRRIDGRAGS